MIVHVHVHALYVCACFVCVYRHVYTCVELPVIHITSAAVSEYISLHPPFCRLVGQVLYKRKRSLEPNHCLVHRHIPVGSVGCLEVGDEGLKERPQLEQGVMALLPLGDVCRVISQVQELHHQAEAVTLENLYYGRISNYLFYFLSADF